MRANTNLFSKTECIVLFKLTCSSHEMWELVLVIG